MRTAVPVVSERRIAAPPEAVWAVITDPAAQERLEPRCRLESASGDSGTVGSSYVLVMRGQRVRSVVVTSEPWVRLVTEASRGSKVAAEQHGELFRDAGVTVLRWTVLLHTGRLTSHLYVANARRELPRWLDAVAREAEAIRAE